MGPMDSGHGIARIGGTIKGPHDTFARLGLRLVSENPDPE